MKDENIDYTELFVAYNEIVFTSGKYKGIKLIDTPAEWQRTYVRVQAEMHRIKQIYDEANRNIQRYDEANRNIQQ